MVLILLLYFSLSPQNDYKIAITNRKKHCRNPSKAADMPSNKKNEEI